MWTSGVVATFDGRKDAAERLAGWSDQRPFGHYQLRSQITLHQPRGREKTEPPILSGTVFDEYLRERPRLVEDDNGRFTLGDPQTVKEVHWGQFWLTTESIAIAQRLDTAEFTFRVLSKALGQPFSSVSFDLQRMAQDTKGHWLGAIYGRKGHVQSATLYGDDIEADSDMGKTYVSNRKRQIGFFTDYFGGRAKVKVTFDGSVTVFSDLTQKRPLYIGFVKDVLLPYKV